MYPSDEVKMRASRWRFLQGNFDCASCLTRNTVRVLTDSSGQPQRAEYQGHPDIVCVCFRCGNKVPHSIASQECVACMGTGMHSAPSGFESLCPICKGHGRADIADSLFDAIMGTIQSMSLCCRMGQHGEMENFGAMRIKEIPVAPAPKYIEDLPTGKEERHAEVRHTPS